MNEDGEDSICGASTDSKTSHNAKQNLNNHIASVHENKKPFKCNICDANFARKPYLKGHIASVHEGKKPYKCNICDTSFTRKENLNRHIALVHEGKKETLQM